ncbi:MAG: Ig-like domain-containing protein [Clostridia bacterium]|nr:Ig-like domain-containing protein [Clostridia bacterium]
MKKIIAFTLSLIIAFSVCIPASATFCKDVIAVRLVVPEDWEMNVGDSRSVEAVFDSSVTDRVLTWSVQPGDVASVDKWGRVTALKEGTATVTATLADGSFSKAELTVAKTATKLEDEAKVKHDYALAAEEEGDALQKIVTRYGKDSAEVPANVKDESNYSSAQTAITADGSKWEITAYGVLRTEENASNERDKEQRFMGDRYFYSNDSENVLAIFPDGKNGIWTVMAEGYTHIEHAEINGTDKAAIMSENSQKYVARRGMVSNSYFNGERWVPNESDNDGLWTSMYGAGELMRYAVLRDDPTATAEEIEAARKTAYLSAEAVLFLSYVSMRSGTTEGYVRAQRNGNVADLDLGKYYTSEALTVGGDYSQNIPGESPADAFKKMNTRYMCFGVRSYIMDEDNLSLYNPSSWSDPSLVTDAEYEKRTRLLDGFIARTYSLKQENNPVDGNVHWVHNGDGTATAVSTKQEGEREYLLHGENYRGTVTDASVEIPQRLWDDLIGSGYELTDVVYKGDTSSDEVIGHLFIYKIAYDILGAEDPEMKELITNTVEKFAQHLVDNNYCLTEATGQPTTWGKYNRAYLHNGQNVGGGALQSAVLLSAFKLAAYMTGDKKWEDEYRMAALDPAYEYAEVMTQYWDRYKMAILEYAASASPIISFIIRPFMETEIIKVIYRMIINYSDEEMAMLAFYLLFQMEDDETLLTYYREAINQWWQYSMSMSENPLWYYIYQLAYPTEEKTDYYGNSLIETASWSLSRHPIDTRKYSATNKNRDDARELDLEEDCGIDGTRVLSYDPREGTPWFSSSDNNIIKVIGIILSGARLKWTIAAPDERAIHKFNNSTYVLEDHHSPYSMEGSTTYTLPYWMGRYHGMLK